ncbi:TetR family transcriptional regulator [Allopusillimonas soli]|uniref:TetR family transcriptional regulator C-terminal domain-containing protein n=2 Tax=Allopusillimonas soli TaxID=659016 RepID=A0A853FBN0_9BURK|nr:TetR family transcriptional regulator C-terminal domain-containing protein [Allopusillimonas soli]TEA74530.1 TetR family transcriptional regulator [Allopusillimonas soli]
MTTMNAVRPARRRGRPPGPTSAHGDARAALVRTGVALLTEKGFSSVGIDEILRAVGVPKGSFYHYFASKQAFGEVLIDAYAAYFAHKLDACLADEHRTPLQRLRDFVEEAKAGMARHDYRRGCLVGNLGQEMAVLPEPYRARLVAVFADWQTRTARCLEAARQAGEVSRDADCTQLAAYFWIGWEGAVLRAKLERSAEPLDIFADGFFALLGVKASAMVQRKGAPPERGAGHTGGTGVQGNTDR